MRVIVVFLLLLFAGVAEAVCPAQPTSLVATGNELSACTDETGMTAIDLKINGVTMPRVPLTMVPGTPIRLTALVGCSIGTIQAAGVNAAGAGLWGAVLPVTFPPCTSAIRLGGPLP